MCYKANMNNKSNVRAVSADKQTVGSLQGARLLFHEDLVTNLIKIFITRAYRYRILDNWRMRIHSQ